MFCVCSLFFAAFACLPCNFAVERQVGKGAEEEGVNSNCICLLRQRHSLPAAAAVAAVTAIFKGCHMEIGGWPKKSCKKGTRQGAGASC